MDELTERFEAERPRLLRIAGRLLSDPSEAEDAVQQAWLRLHANEVELHNLAGWLTTVTTRLCLDRLRAKTPVPVEEVHLVETAGDPADEVALADTVGIALQVVLDRLTPGERVAFVLHDTFAVDFPTVAEILGISPVAARKLASRARHKVAQPSPQGHRPDWEIVDAFLAAAREGDFDRLLELLAPDAVLSADPDALTLGTPERIDGRHAVATFFNGAAQSALPVFVGDSPAAAWYLRGEAKVVFAFEVADDVVRRIQFQAAPEVLAKVDRRAGAERR
jgi:RNA polymerase sigma-70 factor (ECF subfamily)